MKKAVKWILIISSVVVVAVIAAIIIIPMVVDVQQYKPQIENKVSELTGCPVKVGGDIELSLFPWVGLSFSDFHLNNPNGFKEKDFISIQSFDFNIKLIPLIFKDIQVKSFKLKGPRIVLEKAKDGRINWQEIGKKSKKDVSKADQKDSPKKTSPFKLPIKALAVSEILIIDGSVIQIDHIKAEQQEISNFNLQLKDISLDNPFHIICSTIIDGKALNLKGDIGPVGRDFAKGTIPLNLSIKALNELNINLKGNISNLAANPSFDFEFDVSSFSLKNLIASLGEPLSTSDPEALKSLAVKALIKGNAQNVSVSNGVLILDESTLNFNAKVKEFSKPNIFFNLALDEIDIDRYLPPAQEKSKESEKPKDTKPSKQSPSKTDYSKLRQMVLNGDIKIEKIKAFNARIQNFNLNVSGKNGVFNVNPLNLNLYEGSISASSALDLRKSAPKSSIKLEADKIQANPLLNDLLKKDFLEGTAKASIMLNTIGDNAEKIKSSVTGNGYLVFNNGAIKGINLSAMIRNIKSAFGNIKQDKEEPRTDFSEFKIPFEIKNGLVSTSETKFTSPFIRLIAKGKADLVKESLDFRLEPKFVTTIKGQDDTEKRSGIMVPVLVTGNFTSPEFKPDLKGMALKTVEEVVEEGLKDPSKLKETIKDKGKALKEFFKGF
ncbi:AsmA protein [Candidatus Magnetomoraceae bacterium gMMP-15]